MVLAGQSAGVVLIVIFVVAFGCLSTYGAFVLKPRLRAQQAAIRRETKR